MNKNEGQYLFRDGTILSEKDTLDRLTVSIGQTGAFYHMERIKNGGRNETGNNKSDLFRSY